MQTLLLPFFIIFALSAPNPSNGHQVDDGWCPVQFFWLDFQDRQIAREEEVEGRNDRVERESQGVTIWLGPRWIAPGGGRGGGHQQNFRFHSVPRDAALLLVGKRRWPFSHILYQMQDCLAFDSSLMYVCRRFAKFSFPTGLLLQCNPNHKRVSMTFPRWWRIGGLTLKLNICWAQNLCFGHKNTGRSSPALSGHRMDEWDSKEQT